MHFRNDLCMPPVGVYDKHNRLFSFGEGEGPGAGEARGGGGREWGRMINGVSSTVSYVCTNRSSMP